jgi:hypothetical protein
MLNVITRHHCGRKNILSADDPANRVIGFCCQGCDDYWEISLTVVRPGIGNISEHLRETFRSSEGRQKLARMLTSGGVVRIWDEELA